MTKSKTLDSEMADDCAINAVPVNNPNLIKNNIGSDREKDLLFTLKKRSLLIINIAPHLLDFALKLYSKKLESISRASRKTSLSKNSVPLNQQLKTVISGKSEVFEVPNKEYN